MIAIIIEDESEILTGMKEVLETHCSKIEHVYAVSNAEKALLMIRDYHPDLIITDIVLPEMSGLELIEQLPSAPYKPKIVVVSSYSNFHYAQRSIQLGALDYVLKPFDKEEFARKIVEVTELIELEQLQTRELTDQISIAQLGTKALIEKFMLGICMDPTTLQEHIFHRLKMWDMTWLVEKPIVVIALEGEMKSQQRLSEKETELRNFAIGNIVAEILPLYESSVLIKNNSQIWILVTSNPDIKQLCLDIQRNISHYQRMDVNIGIGDWQQSLQHISKSYDQALLASKVGIMNKHSKITFYADIALKEKDIRATNEEIITEIYKRDMNLIRQKVKEIIATFAVSTDVHNIQSLAQKCLDWVVEIIAILRDSIDSNHREIPISLWDAIDECKNITELTEVITAYFELLSKKLSIPLSNAIIDRVKTYMEQSFHEEITLQSLADRVTLHPVWLSQLFKREIGQTFTEYLVELRVNKAKELLRNSNMKIYEIAESIGYQDLQSFGRTFKKKTHLTPKEYRYGK